MGDNVFNDDDLTISGDFPDSDFEQAPPKRTLRRSASEDFTPKQWKRIGELQKTATERASNNPFFVPEGPEKNQPFRQAVGGLGKVFTGIPMLAGMGGAAIEALVDPASDEGFKKNFEKALSTGVDKSLFDAGMTGTNAIAKALNIPVHPKNTLNQVGDLVGSFTVPVPAGFLGGVAAKGATGFAGKAATFLTPAVRLGPKGNRLNKDFAKRAVTQLGVGTALEQGIRAAFPHPDTPLMFSERALTGEASIPSTVIDPRKAGNDDLIGGSFGDDDLLTGSPVQANSFSDDDLVLAPADGFSPEKAAADQAVQDQADTDTMRNIAIGVSALGALFGYNRWQAVRQAARSIPTSEGTELGKQGSGLSRARKIVKAQPTIGEKLTATKLLTQKLLVKKGGDYFDDQVHINQQLRGGTNASEDSIRQLDGQGITDAKGQMDAFFKTGELPDGTFVETPLRDIKRRFDIWEQPRQQQFINFVDALRAESDRIRGTAQDFLGKVDFDTASIETKRAARFVKAATQRGTVDDVERAMLRDEFVDIIANVRGTRETIKPSLFNRATGESVPDEAVASRLALGQADDEFKIMVRELASISNAVLDSAVRRGAQSQAWADSIKRQFTRNGQLLYLPGKEAIEAVKWYKRLAMNMGFFTQQGKTLNQVGNFYKQALGHQEGIASFLDPFNAVAHYAGEIQEATNRSVAQMNLLKEMTGIAFGANGKATLLAPRVNKNAINYQEAPNYVGRSSPTDPNNQFDRMNIEFYRPDSDVSNQFINNLRKNLGPDDPGLKQYTPEQIATLKDSLIVQWNGEFHIFNGFSTGLKSAMEFEAKTVAGFLKFNNFWKTQMTNWTVGKFSPFAPISGLYSMQIGALNAALRAEGGFARSTAEGLQIWKDGIRGAYDIFTTKLADDFAQLLAHTIETGGGMGASNPALLQRMQEMFAKRAKRSMMLPLQGKVGTFASGQNASEFRGNITDALEESVFHISEKYGANALPQFARIWNHLNSALHEGAAFGATLRGVDGDVLGSTANQLRMARKGASDLVGNNRLIGSNALAFNAVVPFSGAMLQAFSSIGRSMYKAGPRKTMATFVVAVGMPTAIEVIYNSVLLPDEKFYDADGKEWTYNSFYWKGFTPEQRNNNVIVFKPGFDPWDAVMIPIVPEISFLKGITIDMMEIVFGLSEHTIAEGNHWAAGGARMANMPLPIALKAGLSALGVDVRAGPSLEGDGPSLIQSRSLPTGNRLTPNLDRVRFQGGELSTRFQAILQDIWGSGARMGVQFYEAINSGTGETPVIRRVEAGLQQLGRSLKQQARYGSFLWGNSVRGSSDPAISGMVHRKKSALTEIKKLNKVLLSGGTMSGSFPAQGRSEDVPIDPIAQALAAEADNIDSKTKPFEIEIGNLRSRINSLSNSLTNEIDLGPNAVPKGPISIKQRDDLIDAYKWQIEAQQDIIKQIYKNEEREFAEIMGKRLGRDLSGFTFDGFVIRPNPRSTSPGLPKLPQTSR